MSKIIQGVVVEPRATWYSDENYNLNYELLDGMVFVHIAIDKFSKAVLRDIKEKWQAFQLRLYSLGYEYVFTYTNDLRIVNMVGGGKVVGEAGGKKVVTWELN